MKGFFYIIMVALALLSPAQSIAQEEAPTVIKDDFFKARILQVTGEQTSDEFGQPLTTQQVNIQLKSGEEKGREISTINEFDPAQQSRRVEAGDYVIVGKQVIGEDITYYINDVYRLRAIWWILGFFILITIIFTKRQGLRAFAGLALSFAIIFYYLIPQILSGSNPFVVAIITAILITSSALFIAHRFTMRTIVAFFSTLGTIFIAIGLSQIFVNASRLTGLGTEEAFYLQFAGTTSINLQGLLLAGIIIGTLGVLDDITTAQAAAVDEISKANPKLSQKELYKRGISVGREHITSLVNTLVLAYTGAALPLLLLFKIYPQPLWVTLNSEIIVEEVMRMLVGSIALIIAVPLTTIIAAWVFSQKGRAKLPKKLYKSCGHTHHHH